MISAPAARTIQSPSDLTSVLREIRAAVARGELEQVPSASSFATCIDVAELPDTGPWPDYIELRFRLRGQGATYLLAVETYHGGGGSWGPEQVSPGPGAT